MNCASRIVAADKSAMAVVARLRRPWLIQAMRYVTSLGSSAVCLPAYIFCLVFSHVPLSNVAAMSLIAEGLLLPCIVYLRYLTRRERPVGMGTHSWTPWNRYSFPSHHSARAWMLVLIVVQFYPSMKLVVLLMAALVSFSRLFLQRHYPSDVLAGAAIGICIAQAVNVILQIICNNL